MLVTGNSPGVASSNVYISLLKNTFLSQLEKLLIVETFQLSPSKRYQGWRVCWIKETDQHICVSQSSQPPSTIRESAPLWKVREKKDSCSPKRYREIVAILYGVVRELEYCSAQQVRTAGVDVGSIQSIMNINQALIFPLDFVPGGRQNCTVKAKHRHCHHSKAITL